MTEVSKALRMFLYSREATQSPPPSAPPAPPAPTPISVRRTELDSFDYDTADIRQISYKKTSTVLERMEKMMESLLEENHEIREENRAIREKQEEMVEEQRRLKNEVSRLTSCLQQNQLIPAHSRNVSPGKYDDRRSRPRSKSPQSSRNLSPGRRPPSPSRRSPSPNHTGNPFLDKERACFICRATDHFARNCPTTERKVTFDDQPKGNGPW